MIKKTLLMSAAGLFALAALTWFLKAPQYDVIVAGGGAAGLSAAIEARTAGASVLILEKMPYIGGNTLRATGGINAAGSEAQKERGIIDSEEAHLADTLEAGHGRNKPALVAAMVHHAADALRWLIGLGADLRDVGYLAGHSEPRTHRPTGGAPAGKEIIGVLENSVRKAGIEIRLETAVTDLLVKNGAVRGVTARDKAGRKFDIRSKTVIIATGGFGGSPRVFVRYNSALEGYNTTNHPGATGDFIALAEQAGARLIDMELIQAHPTVEVDHGVLITEALRGNGGILVDGSGRRFTDELAFRDILSADILKQSEEGAYLIFDEKIRESLSASDSYISNRLVSRGETPSQLAETLGLSAAALTRAIAEYNRLIFSGADDPYQRGGLRVELSTPPYYGIKVLPGVHYCMGGIAIDEEARALNAEGNPIRGLFAAGEATGGIHGENRLGGNSLADAVIFGRIAGRNAAQD